MRRHCDRQTPHPRSPIKTTVLRLSVDGVLLQELNKYPDPMEKKETWKM
jgi:hypothetical protein